MTTYTQGGVFRSFKSDGTPNISGFVYTYAAGTLTPLATYVTPGGSANANPVALGVDGSAKICLTDGVSYRFIEKDALGVSIPGKDTDNIVANSALADLASSAAGKGASLVHYGTGSVETALTSQAAAIVAVDGTLATSRADAAASAAAATAAKLAAQAAAANAIAAAVGIGSSIIGKATQADLYADLVHGAGEIGLVTNDATAANNGYYRKIGASGAGSWTQSSYDRVALVETRIAGIDQTYDEFVGDGVAASFYLHKPTLVAVLQQLDWGGVNPLSTSPTRNKLAKSNSFSDWTVAAGVTLTPNSILAPDGTMTAWLVDWTAAALSSGLYRYTDDVASIGATDIHYVWMRSFSGTESVDFHDAGTSVSSTITLTADWKQYSLSVLHTAVLQGPWFQKSNNTDVKFYIWGAETKATAGPYISTTTAARTVGGYTVDNSNKVTLAQVPVTGTVIRWEPLPAAPSASQNAGDTIAASAAKTTVANADLFGIADSAASDVLKRVSWSSLKGTLNSEYIRVNQGGELTTDLFHVSNASTRVIFGPLSGAGGTGYNHVGIGYGVMVDNTTGYDNVGVGCLALRQNTTGGGHVCVGNQAGYSVTTAYYLTAIGDAALRDATGDRNTALGSYSGRYLTTGHDNVFLGWHAADNQTTNSNLLIIDNQHRASAAAEITDCLIYGLFDSAPSLQWVRVNGKLKVNGDIEMVAGAKLKNVAQPTGTPGAATDLATALALVNSLRASLLALGLVA